MHLSKLANEEPLRFRKAVLVYSFVILLFLGLIYGWSIFKSPFREIFPDWTASNLSLVFTILMCMFSAGTVIGGFLSRRFGPEKVMIAVPVLMFVGFWTVSYFDSSDPKGSFVRLCLLYGVICGFGTGVGYNVALGNIARWFPEKAGMATSILLMAYGIGALLLGSIAKILIGKYGVPSTYRILAVIAAAVLGIGILFVRMPPAKLKEMLAANGTMTEKKALQRKSYPPGVMLRDWAFWVFQLWCIVKSSATMIILNDSANIAAYFGAPAVLGLLISTTTGGGRVLFGTLHDRKGFKKTSAVNSLVMVASGALMLLGAHTRQAPVIIIGLLVTGLASSSTPSLNSAYINRMWGPEFYQMNLGWGCVNILASSVVGPTVGGWLQDHASENAYYNGTFLAMMGFCVLSCVIVFLLNRKTAKEGRLT